LHVLFKYCEQFYQVDNGTNFLELLFE